MRWPQIRIPALPIPEFLGNRMTWIYLAYTTVLFLVCLVLTFPHELLLRRAVESVNRGPMGLDVGSAGLSFKGYEVSGLRIAPRDQDAGAPVLETSHVWLRPTFGQIIRGNPYAATISAELYGGTLDGEVQYKDGGISGSIAWKDLSLNKYRALTAQIPEGQLVGKVSGTMDFEARGNNLAQGQASGELAIDGAALTQAKISGFSIPDIHLRQTKTKYKATGGRLELQDFSSTGDVSLQGSGQIMIKDPVGESVLNLRVTLAATPQTPDAIKGALALLPHQPGAKADAPVNITGTLSHPRLR